MTSTKRAPLNKKLEIALLHNKEFPGLANIRPGRSMKAKIAWSPLTSQTVTWTGDYIVEFSGEY